MSPQPVTTTMNRKQKRELERLRKHAANRTTRRPHQPQMNRPYPWEVTAVFDPVETALAQLREGYILHVNGEPVFRELNGDHSTLVDALRGWNEAWEKITEEFGLQVDNAPMKRLAERLDVGMQIPPPLVEECIRITAAHRQAYARMNVYETRRIALTLETKFLLEKATQNKGENHAD